MTLAPAVANAATARPAHVQTVSNASKASYGGGGYVYVNIPAIYTGTWAW
jgi:hypothetical protein